MPRGYTKSARVVEVIIYVPDRTANEFAVNEVYIYIWILLLGSTMIWNANICSGYFLPP